MQAVTAGILYGGEFKWMGTMILDSEDDNARLAKLIYLMQWIDTLFLDAAEQDVKKTVIKCDWMALNKTSEKLHVLNQRDILTQ